MYIINVRRKSIASVSVSRVIIIIRDRSPCRGTRGDASSSRDDNNVLHVRVAAWPGRPRQSGRDDRRRYTAEAGRFFPTFLFIFFFSPNPSSWSTRTTRITILSERQTEICYFRLSCGKGIYRKNKSWNIYHDFTNDSGRAKTRFIKVINVDAIVDDFESIA